MSGVSVEVSAKKVWFPFECACCSGYPDTELCARPGPTMMQRLTGRRSRGVTVPYCRRCLEHSDRWSFANRAAAATVGAAVVTSLVIARSHTIAAVASCLVGLLAGLAIRVWQRRAAFAQSKHSCVRTRQAIRCLRRSRHGGEFEFASRRYAAKFAIQNVRHLVNVDRELLALIEEYRTRGDSSELPALDEAKSELDWVTVKPRKRPPSLKWWQDSSVSGSASTQLSA